MPGNSVVALSIRDWNAMPSSNVDEATGSAFPERQGLRTEE